MILSQSVPLKDWQSPCNLLPHFCGLIAPSYGSHCCEVAVLMSPSLYSKSMPWRGIFHEHPWHITQQLALGILHSRPLPLRLHEQPHFQVPKTGRKIEHVKPLPIPAFYALPSWLTPCWIQTHICNNKRWPLLLSSDTVEASKPDCQNCANMVLKTSTTERLRTVAPAITKHKVWALALIRAPTPSLPKTLLKPLATSFVAWTADLLWGQKSARQNHFKTHGQVNCSSGPTLNDCQDPQTGTF